MVNPEYIVVGSGAGGGPLAARLAELGQLDREIMRDVEHAKARAGVVATGLEYRERRR